MITLSTIEASDFEGIVIQDDTPGDYRENVARVHRVKTLDGGVHISHLGVSDGDRTLTVTARINEAQAAVLWAFYQDSTFVHVGTPGGFFIAVIKDLEINNGKIKMTILIKEREV